MTNPRSLGNVGGRATTVATGSTRGRGVAVTVRMRSLVVSVAVCTALIAGAQPALADKPNRDAQSPAEAAASAQEGVTFGADVVSDDEVAKAAADSADSEPAPNDDDPGLSGDARERAFMRGAALAGDLRGYEPSLYTGKWYKPAHEDVRRCIMQRESHSNYESTSGVYHGAYQMSRALGVGATWMMQKEVRREFGAEGLRIVQKLRETTPNNWNRYWQDRAFWTIWREGAGRTHWHGGC